MYTIEQFENALLQLNVEIDEMKLKGKYVSKAKGKIDNKMYQWNGNGICEDLKNVRTFEYDLKFE